MLLDKIEKAGLVLSTNGQYLDVTGELTERQRSYFRSNKQKLIVALRLRRIAETYGHDLDDLLSWYREDIEDLYGKSDEDLAIVVNDYIRKQGIYRHCKPVPTCAACFDCEHFTHLDGHSHLGRCTAEGNGASATSLIRGIGSFNCPRLNKDVRKGA